MYLGPRPPAKDWSLVRGPWGDWTGLSTIILSSLPVPRSSHHSPPLSHLTLLRFPAVVTKVLPWGMIKIRYTDQEYHPGENDQDELLLPCCHMHWGEQLPEAWGDVQVIPLPAAADADASVAASSGAVSAAGGAGSSRPRGPLKGPEGLAGESLSRRAVQLVVRQAEEAEVLRAKQGEW